MASVIRYNHDDGGSKQKAETSLFQANSASNAKTQIGSQPATPVRRKNGGFVTSLVPKWNKCQLAGALNMTKDS